MNKQPLTREAFLDLVKQSLDLVSRRAIQGIISSNRKYLAEILRQ